MKRLWSLTSSETEELQPVVRLCTLISDVLFVIQPGTSAINVLFVKQIGTLVFDVLPVVWQSTSASDVFPAEESQRLFKIGSGHHSSVGNRTDQWSRILEAVK